MKALFFALLILTLFSVNFASAQTATFDIRSYGAKANDGRDDSDAIISAINAAAIRGGTVLIPSGRFTLAKRHGPNGVLVVLKSGITIKGQGQKSVLEIPNGFTTGGDYRILAPLMTEAINNLTLTNFRIDGNGANNLVVAPFIDFANIRRAWQIFVAAGDKITISGMWLDNCPGPQVIRIGDDQSTPSVTRVNIIGNRISNVGASIPGNTALTDHSSIYTQTDGGLVQNNILSNARVPSDPITNVVTALEIHGANTIVNNNKVTNFGTGGNAVSSVWAGTGNVWSNNVFNGIAVVGISLWSAGAPTSNLTIKNNQIHMSGGLLIGGIYQRPYNDNNTHQTTGLIITGNTIDGNSKAGYVWNGIMLSTTINGLIQGNSIKNVTGHGIAIANHQISALECSQIDIINNYIQDVGYFGVGFSGIDIENTSNIAILKDIRILGNQIVRINGPTTMWGIRTVALGSIVNLTIDSANQFTNIVDPATNIIHLAPAGLINYNFIP